MLKYLLSYFYPTTLHSQPSKLSKRLEVRYQNGEYTLDSANTTYSFGNLQKVLHAGLKQIPKQHLQNMQSALILGVGAGSVLHTLRHQLHFNGHITGIELDPEVIRLAQIYFELDRVSGIDIRMEDAFEFVLRCQDTYDLIVIDLFEDAKMPSFVYEEFYVKHLKLILKTNGYILFNTIILNKNQEVKNTKYCELFPIQEYTVQRLKKLQPFNELILIHANPTS